MDITAVKENNDVDAIVWVGYPGTHHYLSLSLPPSTSLLLVSVLLCPLSFLFSLLSVPFLVAGAVRCVSLPCVCPLLLLSLTAVSQHVCSSHCPLLPAGPLSPVQVNRAARPSPTSCLGRLTPPAGCRTPFCPVHSPPSPCLTWGYVPTLPFPLLPVLSPLFPVPFWPCVFL